MRVLCGKYKVEEICLQSINRNICSYVWRSLTKVWDQFRERIFWSIGDDKSVTFAKDIGLRVWVHYMGMFSLILVFWNSLWLQILLIGTEIGNGVCCAGGLLLRFWSLSQALILLTTSLEGILAYKKLMLVASSLSRQHIAVFWIGSHRKITLNRNLFGSYLLPLR